MQVSPSGRKCNCHDLPAGMRQDAWEGSIQIEEHADQHSSGPLGTQCQDIEEAYLKDLLDRVRWWTIRFCVLRSLFAIVHATVLMVCIPGRRSQITATTAVAIAYLLMICSCLLVKKSGGKLAVGICCLFIFTEPLLDHYRVSWLLHTHPVQLPMRQGIQLPMDDAVFVLQMLVTVVPFLLLVPVRVVAWIVPVMLPLVYISSTLPLPHHDVENGTINSLSVCLLLSILGVVLMGVAARMEASSHEIFNLRYAQTHMQSDSTLKAQKASIYPKRSRSHSSNRSSTSQKSLAYINTEPSFISFTSFIIPTHQDEESPKARSSTFQALWCCREELRATQDELAELKAELHATQNELVELKAELCATQYVSQLNIFSAKAIFQKHVAEMQRRHWLNTRAVVQSMTQSCSSSRNGSAGRRSQSLPLSKQVQIQSAQSCVTSQLDQGVPSASASSHVQPLRGVSCTPLSESRHSANEGLQFSHPPHQCSVRNTVSQASSRSSLGACSSSSSGSPHSTSLGSHKDSEARACESMCLDGHWEIICDDPDVATWLQWFTVRGSVVQDGVGQVHPLTTNQRNQICFEGGALVLENGLLHRIGKSGKIVSFRRCHRNASPE